MILVPEEARGGWVLVGFGYLAKFQGSPLLVGFRSGRLTELAVWQSRGTFLRDGEGTAHAGAGEAAPPVAPVRMGTGF
jgi:hypothetical protein